MMKLKAPVMRFGGYLCTDDAYIGIVIETAAGYTEPKIRRKNHARGLRDGVIQNVNHVAGNQAMRRRAALHGIHAAVVVLATEFGLTFNGQLFLFRYTRNRRSGHAFIINAPEPGYNARE